MKIETPPECISRGMKTSWRPACACSLCSYMHAQRIDAVHTRGSYWVTVCGYEGLNRLRYNASGPQVTMFHSAGEKFTGSQHVLWASGVGLVSVDRATAMTDTDTYRHMDRHKQKDEERQKDTDIHLHTHTHTHARTHTHTHTHTHLSLIHI